MKTHATYNSPFLPVSAVVSICDTYDLSVEETSQYYLIHLSVAVQISGHKYLFREMELVTIKFRE